MHLSLKYTPTRQRLCRKNYIACVQAQAHNIFVTSFCKTKAIVHDRCARTHEHILAESQNFKDIQPPLTTIVGDSFFHFRILPLYLACTSDTCKLLMRQWNA